MMIEIQNRRDHYTGQLNTLIEPYVKKYVGQTPVLTYVEPENIITIDSIFFNQLPEDIKAEVDRLIKEHNNDINVNHPAKNHFANNDTKQEPQEENTGPIIAEEPGEPEIATDNNEFKTELPATAEELYDSGEIINEPEDVEERGKIDESPAE